MVSRLSLSDNKSPQVSRTIIIIIIIIILLFGWQIKLENKQENMNIFFKFLIN